MICKKIFIQTAIFTLCSISLVADGKPVTKTPDQIAFLSCMGTFIDYLHISAYHKEPIALIADLDCNKELVQKQIKAFLMLHNERFNK